MDEWNLNLWMPRITQGVEELTGGKKGVGGEDARRYLIQVTGLDNGHGDERGDANRRNPQDPAYHLTDHRIEYLHISMPP